METELKFCVMMLSKASSQLGSYTVEAFDLKMALETGILCDYTLENLAVAERIGL